MHKEDMELFDGFNLQRPLRADKMHSGCKRGKYFIDGNYIKPVSKIEPEDINPFDYYKTGNKDKASIHREFANLDISNNSEIEAFYNKYGGLGFFEYDIVKIVSFQPGLGLNMPENSPIAAVQRDSNELVPFDTLINKYHIPDSRILLPKSNDVVLPFWNITSYDTWESLDDFKKECQRYKNMLDIKCAIDCSNTTILRNILKELAKTKNFEREDDDSILLSGSSLLMFTIQEKIQDMVTPSLTRDKTGLRLSQNITWVCKNLLSSLYIMLFHDIASGNLTRKCKNPKCHQYFEASSIRESNVYCNTEKCGNIDKVRISRKEKTKFESLYRQGIPLEEIRQQIDIPDEYKEAYIKKWCEKLKSKE